VVILECICQSLGRLARAAVIDVGEARRAAEDDPSAPGRFIPGATEGVVSAALTVEDVFGGWFGGVRVRYFGPRPLIEDDSVRSGATSLLNARVGYKFDNGLRIQLDAYNLLNVKADQITYYYDSRLPGEPADGVADKHFHPVEPLAVRLTVAGQF